MPGQYTDKPLQCVDCGAAFTFTSGQQAFFAQKGFTNDPKRCDPCRAAKKALGGGERSGNYVGSSGGERRDNGGPREMHVAKCAQCGGEARVPFKPRGDRPVYCSSCFGDRK
jgi:CxxC-x17-CxxC domain-containing protein